MQIRKIQDQNFENQKVLVRADFNVAIVDGKAKERFKLAACKETVDFLAAQKGTKIALCSHLGRPEGKIDPAFSLQDLQDEIEESLGRKVTFVSDCVGEQVQQALENCQAGEILLLENVRFHAGEEKNDLEFAKQLAQHFDVFVNDAFSVSHRDQASVTGVTKFLKSSAGFWLQKEIANLDKVINEPESPAVAIIGGAKIETKLPLINRFGEKYDSILVGGKIANEAIDEKIILSEKVILPLDFAGERWDIGPKTIEKFKAIIAEAKVIVWNGPLGKFEEKPYDQGTREILAAVASSQAFTLIGGGESVEVLEENNLMDKISFVSTGGGAMLEYLSGNSMPGIEALKKKRFWFF